MASFHHRQKILQVIIKRLFCVIGKSSYWILDLTYRTTNEELTTIVSIFQTTLAAYPIRKHRRLDCVLSNLRVRIFFLQPDEPKSSVRLGTYDIINNTSDRKIIGTAQVGFTCGQGEFKNLFNGYADLETIPFSTDHRAHLVYSLKPK